MSANGAIIEQVRRRRFPIIGTGGGIWSFIHIADAAGATVAALEGEAIGVFNVVDDEPAPVAAWLPVLAAAVGAKPPLRLPAFLGRLVLPHHLYVMMTDIRGASNAGLSTPSLGDRPGPRGVKASNADSVQWGLLMLENGLKALRARPWREREVARKLRSSVSKDESS